MGVGVARLVFWEFVVGRDARGGVCARKVCRREGMGMEELTCQKNGRTFVLATNRRTNTIQRRRCIVIVFGFR